MNVPRTAAMALSLAAILFGCFISCQPSNAQEKPIDHPGAASWPAASAPARGSSRPVAERAGWQMVWSDEFDNEGLPDPKKWTYEVGFVRNQEKQYYTQARKENARVEHGVLIIEGRKEHFPKAQYDPKTKGNGRKDRENADYTSASITTEGKASWTYGRIEVRARLPQGKGVWPAIWTLGTSLPRIGWPRCGEIDIMEFVGHQPDKVHGTVHYGLDGKHLSRGDKLTVDKLWEGFHVYAIEWEAARIDFFFDDTKYFTFKTAGADSHGSNAFHQPHYLLLNLALGGSWGGKIDDSILPQQYVVDYVRVYQRPGTTTTSRRDLRDKNIAVEKTSQGELAVEPINHSAIRFEFKGRQYYVDPAGEAAWDEMPKANAIFITHEHFDHLSPKVIDQVKKDGTVIYANAASVKKAGFGQTIEVGEKKQVLDIAVEAVPAYNLNPDRQKYHPKDRKDNGYVLAFGDKRVYVAGDTEGTPEMKALKDIAIAFLPINLPYTMEPTDAAEAARAFKPRVLYPYHQGKSNPEEVKKLLADVKEIQVRVLALP